MAVERDQQKADLKEPTMAGYSAALMVSTKVDPRACYSAAKTADQMVESWDKLTDNSMAAQTVERTVVPKEDSTAVETVDLREDSSADPRED